MIDSDKSVATYDLNPIMQAKAITDRLLEAINEEKYDFILCNYANPDMIGHTGNYLATCKGLNYLDGYITQIAEKAQEKNIHLFITSDRGNAEEMFDEQTQQPHTEHTCNPVPLFYQGPYDKKLKQEGSLIDVAPTILEILNLPIPLEMTGKTLWIKKGGPEDHPFNVLKIIFEKNFIIPPMKGVSGLFSLESSVTTTSVVNIKSAMEAAFKKAKRVTFAGSTTPISKRSPYSLVLRLYP